MSKFKQYLEAARGGSVFSSGTVFKEDGKDAWTVGIKYKGKPYTFQVKELTVENLKKAFLTFIETELKDNSLVQRVQNTIENKNGIFDYFPILRNPNFLNLK